MGLRRKMVRVHIKPKESKFRLGLRENVKRRKNSG